MRLYLASLYECNQDCIFCVRKGDNEPIKFLDTQEVKDVLTRKRKEGYDEVIFDGGEPTLRKDITEVLDFVKQNQFRSASILTNGVLLSDAQLAKKIISIGNARNFSIGLSVSLHSHKEKISDKLTNAPGTFAKTIQGIKNLISDGCSYLSVYQVITEYNYRDLPSFVNFIHSNFPPINHITFSFIYPAGAALSNIHIYPRLSRVAGYLRRALSLCKKYKIKFNLTTCGTIPLCFLKGYENILIDQQEKDQPENVGLLDSGQDQGFQLATKEFHKKTKIKTPQCLECFYNDQCGGIWRVYVEKYGTGELRPVLRKTKTRKQKEGKTKESLVLLLGSACNNNCIFCSVGTSSHYSYSTEEALAELNKAYEQGYRNIDFIGGEPTIRADFLKLVSYAKRRGYRRIMVTTNGRRFSYRDFTRRAVEAGLTEATFSLYGDKKLLHNGITRTPDAFQQCVSGIKNAINAGLRVTVNTVISRLNYKKLLELGLFINKLGVKEWHILELLPDGRCAQLYNSLSVNLIDLSEELNKISRISRLFNELDIFDFPFCIFEPKMFKRRDINFVTAKRRYENLSQASPCGLSLRIKETIVNSKVLHEDKYKIKPAICRDCKYFNECSGIMKPYFALRRDSEIKKLFKKYHLNRR